MRLYARDGALGIGELTDTGDLTFTELRRTRTHRNADKSGRYRWYNDYELPQRHGGGTLTVRLHGNDDDRARKLNRTENLRPIPPGDPDFAPVSDSHTRDVRPRRTNLREARATQDLTAGRA